MKNLFVSVAVLLSSVSAFAEKPTLESYVGEYRGVSGVSSESFPESWKYNCALEHPIRVTLTQDENGPRLDQWDLDPQSEKPRLRDVDSQTFYSIGRSSSGSEWWGPKQVIGSFKCKQTKSGAIEMTQKISVRYLGLIPGGSSKTVRTLKLEDEGRTLVYRRTIDKELVAECRYERIN